tara:strand:- start:126 stop:674 length:549 start_codon:yes stop_codon:yes gene_type:complete
MSIDTLNVDVPTTLVLWTKESKMLSLLPFDTRPPECSVKFKVNRQYLEDALTFFSSPVLDWFVPDSLNGPMRISDGTNFILVMLERPTQDEELGGFSWGKDVTIPAARLSRAISLIESKCSIRPELRGTQEEPIIILERKLYSPVDKDWAIRGEEDRAKDPDLKYVPVEIEDIPITVRYIWG